MSRDPLHAMAHRVLALIAPLALALAFANPVVGQVRGGVQVGASAFYLQSNYEGPTFPRGSLTYGAWIGASVAGPVGLRIEGNLSSRGFHQREDHGVRLDVLEVPVLVTYDLHRSSADAAYVVAGVTGSFKRDCEQTTAAPGPPGIPMPSVTAPCDGSARLNPVIANDREFSLTIGGGSAVTFGPSRLTLDARLLGGVTRQLGIIVPRSTEVGIRDTDFAARTWAIQILMGVGIG